MLKLRDYAASAGVSYEAVRKQIKRYEAELDGHIHTQGRTQFLDDVAVAFLDEHRAQTPLVLYDSSNDARIRELEAENREISQKLLMLHEEHTNLFRRIDQYHALELESAKNRFALEAAAEKHQALTSELAESRQAAEKASAKVEELQKKLAAAEARESALRDECDAMRKRGLLARIRNR